MKAAIYARVSTDAQEAVNQIESILNWGIARDWYTREDYNYGRIPVYVEAESAWKAGHQKELARLVNDARFGKVDTILVWALDRLSREGSLAILSLINKLKSYGCRVISYQESWTETPGDLAELLYALAGWVARMESQRRSERTKAGLARLAAQGKRLGRPPGSKDRRKRKKIIRVYDGFHN